MLDFLKSISEIKRDPLDLKVALERVALYDKEIRGKDSWEVKTILKQNEYDFLNIRHAKLEEVVPAILGFDYEKYKMLHNIYKIQKCNDNIIEIAEKSISEIPEDLPESAKQEIRDHIEKDIEKYRRQPRTLYSSGGAVLYNRVSHFLELFRRAYISGDVAICGDWIDLDTIVDTKVFFEWVQRNGFYIPKEVSCLLTDSVTATTTESPGMERIKNEKHDIEIRAKDQALIIAGQQIAKGRRMTKPQMRIALLESGFRDADISDRLLIRIWKEMPPESKNQGGRPKKSE